MAYDDNSLGVPEFKEFKCTRCKNVFKITNTNSAECSFCVTAKRGNTVYKKLKRQYDLEPKPGAV